MAETGVPLLEHFFFLLGLENHCSKASVGLVGKVDFFRRHGFSMSEVVGTEEEGWLS